MEKIKFNMLVEQMHEMGALSGDALAACQRLDVSDAFTLSNYLTNIRALHTAAEGDLDVVQELVNIAMEVWTSLHEADSLEVDSGNGRTTKTLTLYVDRDTFNAIVKGKRTKYTVEVTPKNVTQLIMLDDEGYEKEDHKGNSIPILYDSIRFCTGRGPVVLTALVELKWCYTEMFVDEDGRVITFEHDGRDWVEEQVVYDLGKQLPTDAQVE